MRVVGWGLRVDSDLAIETAEKNPSPPTPLPEAGRGEMEMDGVVASGGSLASGRTRQPGSKKPPECLRTTANIKTTQPPVKTGTTNPNSHPRARAATGKKKPTTRSVVLLWPLHPLPLSRLSNPGIPTKVTIPRTCVRTTSKTIILVG